MAVLDGNVVRWTVRYKDTETLRAVDPDVVEFAAQIGDSTPGATITYGSATTPAVGTIARRGLGWYETWTNATAADQFAKWTSTGAGQATVEDSIEGEPTRF